MQLYRVSLQPENLWTTHRLRQSAKPAVQKGGSLPHRATRTFVQPEARQGTAVAEPRPSHLASHEPTEAELTSTVQAELEALQDEKGRAPFQWMEQWYPMAFVADLDPKKPHAQRLFGQEMVVWRDAEGEWRCFEDSCPHRLAPLSEGRIEPSDGTLMCSYHGWRFDGSGRAVAVPQAAAVDAQAEAVACASRRSCAASYPTKVECGYLWVWPQSGPEAWIHSAAVQPVINSRVRALSPEQISASTCEQFVRDFPIAFDIFLENICDQSHVPFAHNGVAGNRNSQWAGFFRIANVKRANPQAAFHNKGFTFDLTWSPDGINPPVTQQVAFVPPNYIEYITEKDPPGSMTILWFYLTPLGPHTTRLITHSLVTAPMPRPLSALLAARPRWLDHLVLNEVFDGDVVYLYRQNRALKGSRGGGAAWAKDYFLVAEADRSIMQFRKWYFSEGGGGPEAFKGAPLPPADIPRSVMLSRYEQHTKNCPSCRKGLKMSQTGQAACKLAATAVALGAVLNVNNGDALLSPGTAAAAVGIGALLWLSSKLRWLENKFVYTDYVHAEK